MRPRGRGLCPQGLETPCEPLQVRAAQVFADDLVAHRVPSVRAIRARLRFGQSRIASGYRPDPRQFGGDVRLNAAQCTRAVAGSDEEAGIRAAGSCVPRFTACLSGHARTPHGPVAIAVPLQKQPFGYAASSRSEKERYRRRPCCRSGCAAGLSAVVPGPVTLCGRAHCGNSEKWCATRSHKGGERS
jgi:hypothetical protein